ncbi:hypothetical protein BGZ98_005057, partial [Dissophora globulifera]
MNKDYIRTTSASQTGRAIAAILRDTVDLGKQADICIADYCEDGSRQHLVVSGDSDLLVYQAIDSVLRPIPRSRLYAIYDNADVLDILKFDDPIQLVLLGIVSYLDYAKNIYGSQRRFDPIHPRLKEFETQKALRVTNAAVLHAHRRSNLPFYMAKQSKRNQLRPLITQGSILSGGTIVISRCRQRPAPRRGPQTKRRKHLAKQQKVVKKKQPKWAKKNPTDKKRNLASATVQEHQQELPTE